MNTSQLRQCMQSWSPDQLLAVIDFCQIIADGIWDDHEPRLIEHLRNPPTTPAIDCPDKPVESNLSLPLEFDDDLDF